MTDHQQVLALARDDLACYAIAHMPQFELASHHRKTIEKLEAVARGEIKRLMIFEPPRHGKSLTATQFFPAWYFGRNPTKSIISSTYGQDLSDDFGRKVRNICASEIQRAIFPGFTISEDASAIRRFTTSVGGSYYAVGRGGPITGRGADLLLIDDPLKDAEEARSEVVRKTLHEWFSSVAYTRLQPDGAIVLVQTRWHEDDLAGRLLTQGEHWEVINMPAIAEEDNSFRKAGEALWPERFPLPVLEAIRLQIGGSAWASLYQQRPSAAQGAIFRRDWWRTYRELPAVFKRKVQSWDTAFKTGAENDYSVCTTWGVTDNGYYLLARWRERVEFPELKRVVALQADEWLPNAILVEDKASGQSLIQELKLATRFPILAIKVDSDKVTRAEAVTPLIEAGRVYLPESAPWLADFIDETAAFPNAAHDDQVDSTTQALNYFRQQGIPAVVSFWKKQQETAGQPAATPAGAVPCEFCGASSTMLQIRRKSFCCDVFRRKWLEEQALKEQAAALPIPSESELMAGSEVHG
jgi:predicted phage terminase large subunit-like protein